VLRAQHGESMCTIINFSLYIQVYILKVLFMKYCFAQRLKD
jgi:hypothetical protein